MSDQRLKLLLISEAAFAGIYIAFTRGLIFVYLVSIGNGVDGISLVVGVVAMVTTAVHVLLYKKPSFLVNRVKEKFTFFHGLERILWIFIPLTNDTILIIIIFSVINSLPTGSFMNLVTYGSLSEDEIKDVTSKRFAAFGVSTLIGFALAMFLVALLPPDTKYFYIFLFGALIGLMSTISVFLMKMSKVEGMQMPKGIEQPDRVFSTSSFFVALLASGNLLAMIWTPYLIEELGAPDFYVVAMSLAGTIFSVAGAYVWGGRSFKTLRYSLALDVVTPAIAPIVQMPLLHVLLSGGSAFTYTGGNFVGNFLFARYNKWLGAIKSSILLTIVLGVAQVLAAIIGVLLARTLFIYLFLVVVAIKAISVILATFTIPEVAFVPEESARQYSSTVYDTSIMGYEVSVESSKESILLMVKLAGIAIMVTILYIIYRVLFLLIA